MSAKFRILLVSLVPDKASALAEYLSATYEVHVATSAEEALAIWRQNGPLDLTVVGQCLMDDSNAAQVHALTEALGSRQILVINVRDWSKCKAAGKINDEIGIMKATQDISGLIGAIENAINSATKLAAVH